MSVHFKDTVNALYNVDLGLGRLIDGVFRTFCLTPGISVAFVMPGRYEANAWDNSTRSSFL
eukprot:3929280-Rhodomonas_salina.2